VRLRQLFLKGFFGVGPGPGTSPNFTRQGKKLQPGKPAHAILARDFLSVVGTHRIGRSATLDAAIYNSGVNFRLRDLRRGDFDPLWTLDQECFPPGIAYTRFELAAYLRRSGAFTLVAASPEGTDILGFIVAEANRRRVGHIITIDVRPAARRLGIASELLSATETRLRSAECRVVRLETAVDNRGALAFYQRHHYEVIKTQPGYYSNGLDAFLLQKDLLSTAPEAKLLT
jgi:ribosomal-protein-alanine N-acetyltransferase